MRRRASARCAIWSPGATTCSPRRSRLLFRRLAVFAGGGDLHAIAAIAADGDPIAALEGLEALVGQSLLERAASTGEPGRFAMLETVRAFAQEQLASSDEEARDPGRPRRLLPGLGRAGAGGFGRDERGGAWLPRLEAEHANLRAALGWSLSRGDAETAGPARQRPRPLLAGARSSQRGAPLAGAGL